MGDEANNQMGPSGVQLTPATTTPAANGGSAIRPRIEVAVSNEPPMKRIKVEQTGGDSDGSMILNSQSITVNDPNQATMSEPVPASQPIKTVACGQNVEKEAVSQIAVNPASVKQEQSSGSVVTNSSIASSSSASAGSLCAPTAAGNSKTNLGAVSQPVAPPNPIQPAHSSSALGVAPSAPLKSTTMAHLRTKYTAELEYMLREFRKLERQLLGAKGAAQIEESVGSRERREKLHSFILHLEDTIRQIETGCRLEAEGKNTVGVAADASQTPDSTDAAKKQMAETSALTNLTKEKEEEENVQKLEEHILANLLPVKVRLKKQLAAQQGATKNPAGMPAPRRGLQPVASNRGKGTFAAAAEEKRKQAEAARLAAEELQRPVVSSVSDPTQFGTPLGGGGSSLTQKLHGATLGSKTRIHGYGVGTSSTAATRTTPEKKILYAGMVPGSSQHHSGVAAAFGVHDMVIKNPNLKTIVQSQPTGASKPPANVVIKRDSTATAGEQISEQVQTAPLGAEASFANADKKALLDQNLTEEERKKLRKHRRKRKLQRIARRRERERQRQLALHQQQTGSSKMGGVRKKTIAGKSQGKKKGPRAVEYICALCSEAYNSTCDYNPWWALAQHECHKCRKNQVSVDLFNESKAIKNFWLTV